MIITEIKIKHLKIRISEFEDLIFDKNILPMFTTSSILKEVDAKKISKYKIETLNPNKKLNFKVITFNEIIEELTNKINKVANNLEPYYFSDPSYYKSLPDKVKIVLDKYKLIQEKKEIKDSLIRFKKSIIKFPIARNKIKNLKNIFKFKNIKNNTIRFKKSKSIIKNHATSKKKKI